MYDFDTFLNELKVKMGDPALRGSLIARYPEFRTSVADFLRATEPFAAPEPLPALSDMTAVQAAICDNWPSDKPVKSRPNRYGIVIEVWTAPAGDIRTHRKKDYQAKATASLCGKKELAATVKRAVNPKLKNPISADYADHLLALAAQMEPHHTIGMLAHKSPQDGIFYFSNQFVFVADPGTSDAMASLFIDGEIRPLARFSPYQPDGITRHGGNFVSQARCDWCDFSLTWRTDEWA